MSDNLTLDQKLNDLEARLDETVSKAKKRRSTITIVFVILAIFMCGYLYFAYSQIKKLDANTVVSIAEVQAQPYLQRSAPEWAAELKKQAPNLIDTAGEALLTVPDAMSDQVANYVDATIDEEMPRIQEEFKDLVLRLVDEAAKAKDENMKDGEFTEADAKELATMVAQQFEDSLKSEINKLYTSYSSLTDEMITHLDKLASDQGLSETESLHREILVNFLALMKKVKANPPAGTAGDVLP